MINETLLPGLSQKEKYTQHDSTEQDALFAEKVVLVNARSLSKILGKSELQLGRERVTGRSRGIFLECVHLNRS